MGKKRKGGREKSICWRCSYRLPLVLHVLTSVRHIAEEGTLTMESEFGDCDDGSTESVEARKVALMVSQSIVSLSTFAGGKRIRVGSGFVMRWNDSTDRHMIITAATLVRSIDGENTVVPDLMVKVLLPNGNITDGHIFLVDFHYNIAVIEVASDTKLMNVSAAKDIVTRGDVLALGRAYEGGNLMCSRGRIVHQTSTFGCSELLTSCCKFTMVGAGRPLVNYSGHVVGINFYEKNQTPYLSIAIVLRILDHYHSFGLPRDHPPMWPGYVSVTSLSNVKERFSQQPQSTTRYMQGVCGDTT